MKRGRPGGAQRGVGQRQRLRGRRRERAGAARRRRCARRRHRRCCCRRRAAAGASAGRMSMDALLQLVQQNPDLKARMQAIVARTDLSEPQKMDAIRNLVHQVASPQPLRPRARARSAPRPRCRRRRDLVNLSRACRTRSVRTSTYSSRAACTQHSSVLVASALTSVAGLLQVQ